MIQHFVKNIITNNIIAGFNMKKIVFALFFQIYFVLMSASYAQDTLVKGGFKACHVFEYKYVNGKVDSSLKKKLAYYTFNESGQKIAEERYGTDNSISHNYTWKYDMQKNETEFIWSTKKRTGYDGGDGLGVKWWTISNSGITNKTYDNSGNLIKETQYDSAKAYTRMYTWKYDDKGNKIEEVKIISKDIAPEKTTFKYNMDGKMTEKTLWYDENNIKNILKYSYDSKGNKIKAVKYNMSDKIIDSCAFIYNEKNLMLEEIDYNSDGTFTNHYIMQYDDAGNKIAEIFENKKESRWGKETWGYDAYGNIIEWVVFKNTNEPKLKTCYVYTD